MTAVGFLGCAHRERGATAPPPAHPALVAAAEARTSLEAAFAADDVSRLQALFSPELAGTRDFCKTVVESGVDEVVVSVTPTGVTGAGVVTDLSMLVVLSDGGGTARHRLAGAYLERVTGGGWRILQQRFQPGEGPLFPDGLLDGLRLPELHQGQPPRFPGGQPRGQVSLGQARHVLRQFLGHLPLAPEPAGQHHQPAHVSPTA
jgi:hypothetical protein